MSARRLLQLLLVIQALAALGIGLAAVQIFGAGRWTALGLGLGSVVLVRLLINANNFAMSARFASPTPGEYQLGPGARLRMFFEEFGASMLQSSWTMPRASARTRIHPGAKAPPVLLLHGYGCNSGYWSHLVPRLDAAGISHASVDLEPLTGDIDEVEEDTRLWVQSKRSWLCMFLQTAGSCACLLEYSPPPSLPMNVQSIRGEQWP